MKLKEKLSSFCTIHSVSLCNNTFKNQDAQRKDSSVAEGQISKQYTQSDAHNINGPANSMA